MIDVTKPFPISPVMQLETVIDSPAVVQARMIATFTREKVALQEQIAGLKIALAVMEADRDRKLARALAAEHSHRELTRNAAYAAQREAAKTKEVAI